MLIVVAVDGNISKHANIGCGRVHVESEPYRMTGEWRLRWRRTVLTAKSKCEDWPLRDGDRQI